MTTDLVAVSPDDSLETAAKTMRNRRTRYLLVVRDGEIQGIVSAFDIAQSISEAKDLQITDLTHYITHG
jgi:CBS domain-containing protein